MSGTAGDSVTRWLSALRAGESQAADQLWDRYYEKLVSLAKRQINSCATGIGDEQDVVVSVFDTLFRGVQEGRFSQLQDRSDLWCLLIALTKQKSADIKRHESRQKRGGGNVRHESEVAWDTSVGFTLDTLCGDVPTPEFMAALKEEHSKLMDLLQDEVLRQIATWTLEGYAPEEIAEQLSVSVRTVQRKLRLIREIWSQQFWSR